VFIGHVALGLGAKRIAPKAPLAALLAAAGFLDLLWPVLLIAGLEHVRIDPGNTAFTPLDFYDYPISHSLVTTVGWSLLFGGAYMAITRDRAGALMCAFLVTSHWGLDWISHRPDLPLYPGASSRFGLGLWNSVASTFVVELVLFAAGIALYLRKVKRGGIGPNRFWGFISVLLIAYFANYFSPAPTSVMELAWGALAGAVLLVWWGWWIERKPAAERAP
jgi:hypothetical protein